MYADDDAAQHAGGARDWGVLPVLFAAHKLTGPREVPNPSRALAGESSVNLSEEGQGEIP